MHSHLIGERPGIAFPLERLWRPTHQVFAQRAKLPRDKTILVYCNTSSFAAQVAMALRMDGIENVRLLYGSYNEWKARGGLEAYARATRKN